LCEAADVVKRAGQSARRSSGVDVIEVGIGDIGLATAPTKLITPALGSCVGVAIYDRFAKRGAMAHVMLPLMGAGAGNSASGRFADYAIPMMVQLLREQGSLLSRLEAKIAGGAAMFSGDSTISGIGERNVAEVKRQLKLTSVPLIAEDTGEAHARTVELSLETGELMVRSYQFGVRRL
jgi:chemotaxis protein CheD